MKGNTFVEPTSQPLNMKYDRVLCKKPLISLNGNKIQSKMNMTIVNQKIVNCTYIPFYETFLFLCDDWNIYVYTGELELITKLPNWDSKYCVGFEYLETYEALVLISVDEISVVLLNIQTNKLKTKFLSSIKFTLQKKEIFTVDSKTKLKWHKGYNYCLEERMIWAWSLQGINFYTLPNLKLKNHVQNITKKEAAITYVYYDSITKYTVTGLLNGNIVIWRIGMSQDSEATMVHIFQQHSRAVEQIIKGKDGLSIMSHSVDMTTCLWSLETFELLRLFNFSQEYTTLLLLDTKLAFIGKGEMLEELHFGKEMQFITKVESTIIHTHKEFKEGKVKAIQLTLSVNVGLSISCLFPSSRIHKMDIPLFYPPLKAKSIKQIIANPYKENQYYMLVESGEVYRLRIEDNASKIEESYKLQRALDSEEHQINLIPNVINFLSILPPRFDSEFNEESLIENKKEINSVAEAKLMAVGCEKGTVIFVSVDNMNAIHTRLTYHRETIIKVEGVHTEHGDVLVTMCQEYQIKFIRFEQSKAICYLTVPCPNKIRILQAFGPVLIAIFYDRIIEIFNFEDHFQPKTRQTNEPLQHEGEINVVDHHSNLKLILTAATDNIVKFWTYGKVLIYSITFDAGLHLALFTNDFDLLIAHNQQLFLLSNLPIRLNNEELNHYDQNSVTSHLSTLISFQDSIRSTFSESKLNSVQLEELKEPFEKQNSFIHSSPIKIKKINKERRSISFQEKRIEKEEETRKKQAANARLKATSHHIEELRDLKKNVNQSILPKIAPYTENKFEKFVQAKISAKKAFSRRDITLNRIIMKNLLENKFDEAKDLVESIKLEF